MNYKKIFAILLAILLLSQTIPLNQFSLYKDNESYAAKEVAVSKPSVPESPVSPKVTIEAIPTPALTQTQNNIKESSNNNKDKEENKKNQILVKYKDANKKENTKKKLISKKPKLKLSLKKSVKRINMEILELSDSKDITGTIEELKKDSNVEYVQPNYVLDTYFMPQDERFSEQWGLSNNGQAVSGSTGTAGIDINAVNVWDITTGSNEVTIGIVDTGLDINHPDICGNIFVNTNEQLDGVDNDGNGYIDDLNGFDFANGDSSVFDSPSQDTHGTHIAGILAAGVNNGGIAGVAPNIKILPLKFISGNTGYTSDAIDAINYGLSKGIKIFNCSWGGSQENLALKDIMANSDALFICAAGNAGQNVDVNPVYPACYQLPNVISVGAIDNKGQLASFSNYGSKVQIAAPGAGILSTLPGNNYGLMSGTSMATPFITGVAALLKSKYPTMSASEIKTRILNNATYEQNLTGKVSTSGRLNAAAALLNNAPSYTVQPTTEPTPTSSPVYKSKEPEPIYDNSASGNNKIRKPVMSESNLFIDAAIKTGIAKMSSDNGIENLSLFRVKEKFVTIIWTTAVESNTEFHYGNTESVEKVYTSNSMTTKHQVVINIESLDEVRYFVAKSVTQDGTEFKTDVKISADYLTDLGGSAPIFPDTASNNNETSLSNVSIMSYMEDNGTNHSFATAQQISQGTLFGTAEQSAGSDYYKIPFTAGKTYIIKLMGMAQGEDYDIYLYNSEQSSAIGVSNVGGNYDENIEYTPTTTGIYYLEVMPYSSTSANHNYQLMIYSQDCPPDSYEPNDGHLAATPVTAGSTTAATINVSTDEDWFVLDTTKTGKLNITLKNIPMGCDYDLEVFKDDFITPIDGSYSCTNYDEKITWLINETGKYYIRVYHATGSNASVPYELQANVYTSDAYEVNDDAYDVKNAGTPSIDLGSYTSATIDNPDDIDFFKFTINSSTNVGLRLQNIPEGMDYDLELYSYDSLTNRFSMISGSTCVSNYDETIINQLSAGSYYVKVCSYSGSSETQNYKLSVTDENAGEIKIEFDKTNASVGEIITARIKVKNVPHLSGYQVNLKYDPQVIDPVDKYQRPYKTVTVPESGDILINQDYWPYQRALHDFDNGILNFGKVYLGVTGYKESGVDDNTGTLAIVQFKVIKNNMIKVSFEASSAMPGSSSGVDLFDWDGEKISGGYTVDKSVVANSDLPENPMSVSSLSEDVEQGVLLNAFETYRISGCIGSTKTKENFTIKILRETEVCAGPISTDSNGLFNFLFSPTQNGIYKIVISKEGHLTREIGGVTFGSNIQIGSRSEPLSIWAGDVNNDDAINISDIMILATRFNKVCTYDTDIKLDLNGDNAINISDVMIMAGHFNRTVSNYPKANIIESPRGLVSVSAGEHHSVALKEDGTVLAWGRGICGQLGDGKGCSSSQPVKVNLNKKIVAVSAGTWHTVFLTEEGEVYWCGKCVDGNNVLTPTKVVGIPTAKAIAAGENYTLVLTENGDVYSWGVNYNGQLGYTTTTQVTSTPQKINSITGVEAISARSCYSLALKNGEIYEWGSTVHGDLTTPSKVVGISNAKAIAAGGAYAGSFAVVLKQDGTAIEYGTKLDCGTAVQFGSVGGRNLGEFQNAISVSAGANHAVILKQDGSVYTLGENNKGQLGNGGAFSNTPVKVPGLSNVIAIAAGAEHTLAITGGTYYAWGDSADGKLGDGQDYIKTVPSEIAIPENIAAEDDARLDYISVNDNIMDVIGGKSIYGYSCIFGSSVPTIQAVPVNEFATVDITPPSALPGYANIVVTSQNGKIQKAYRVKVELCSYGFIEQAGEIDIYEFTSPTTGTYSISSEGNIDTYIKIFDGETEIATCDDSAQDNNFYLDVSLEAGKTYTLKVGHSDETGTGPYRIIIGTTDRADLDYSQYEVYLEDLAVEAGGTYERLDSNKARVKIEYKVKVNEVERTEEVVRVFSGKVINDRIVITQMEFDNAFTGMFSGGSDIQASSYQDDSVGSMYYLLPKNPLGLSDSDQKYLRFRFYETSYGESDANNDAYNSGSTGALTGTIDNIRRIQELLQKLKCWVNPDGTVSKCSATGGFFEVTKASIQKFQREYMYAKESEVTGKVDKETKLSLEKYNLIWQLYGNGVKPEGVRVREYLAKWHNIYNGVGFEQQHVTINNEPLEIGGLILPTYRDQRCYAKVYNIDSALINLYSGISINILGYDSQPLITGTNTEFVFILNNTEGNINADVVVECSWDQKKWWPKKSLYMTIPANYSNTLRFSYQIDNPGKLYTRVIIKNGQIGVEYLNVTKGLADEVQRKNLFEQADIKEASALLLLLDEFVDRLEKENIWYTSDLEKAGGDLPDRRIRDHEYNKGLWEQSIFTLELELLKNPFIESNTNVYSLILNSLKNAEAFASREYVNNALIASLKTNSVFAATYDQMKQDVGNNNLSMVLNFTPGIGLVKGLVEGITGKDALTGNSLAWWERALGFLCVGEIKGAVRASALLKGANNASDVMAALKKIGKISETVAEALGRKSVRILDETADITLSSRVKEIRNLLTSAYKKTGNFGYANVSIEGLSKSEYYAHSAIQELTGDLANRVPNISLKPIESEFKSLSVNSQNIIGGEGAWDRIVDTEFKILDDISKNLNGRNASGTIKLFTELPPCPSCDDVILQFLQKYPNIKIEVIHNNGVKLVP